MPEDSYPHLEKVRQLEAAGDCSGADQYSLDDGTEITRQVFVSDPDNVIAVMISANRDVNVKVSLDKGVIENRDIVQTGAGTGENATRFVGRFAQKVPDIYFPLIANVPAPFRNLHVVGKTEIRLDTNGMTTICYLDYVTVRADPEVARKSPK
jgi:hypothetical protein